MAKDMGYVKNVVKEVKQTARRASNSLSKSDREGYEKKYGRKIDIKIGNSKVKEQVGQLAGAVLQGRRYDEKGKQITPKYKKIDEKKTVTKPTSRMGAAMAKKAVAPKPAVKKVAPGAKGTRNEPMKAVRILGGTGVAKGARLEKGMSRARSISGSKKKTK